ncbi:MAG: ABC transporter ATP-binding protein [Candidatus Cloacimonadaceae bacterium]|jgi:phospholipid/cholesterol/gamma-HCH transport system ATP-binding protein
MQNETPIITIRGLKAQYGEKVVLQDINADIYAGQVTVILGSSGCGKTTLLKNMLRLHEPVGGSVKFWGTELLTLDEIEFNNMLKKVGMLFQNGALLNSISVMDNIAIPLEQHTKLSRRIIEKMIRVKLNLVGLSHAIHLLPSELSGGMKKRAGLARAMIMDPHILFCDEPSAGLDPLTSASLDELILDLKSQLNMTIVMVTHELASIHRVADRVLFLDKGRLLFQGTLSDARAARIPEIDTFFEVGKFE